MLLGEIHQLVHQLGVEHRERNEDGNLADELLLDVGQQLNGRNLQLKLILPPLLGLAARLYIKEGTFAQISLIGDPVVTEERQFGGTGIIFYLGDTIRITVLAGTTAQGGDDTAHRDFSSHKGFLVLEFGHAGIAYMLQHHGILVQWMGRKIDSYQIALLVQTVEVAPPFGIGNLGRSNIHHILATKERIGRRSLVSLITVTVAHK